MIKSWKNKEKKDQQFFGGRRVKGSGNQWDAPGDIKTNTLLVDSKHTDKKSYTITLKTWDKLYEEALFAKRVPVLSLQIQNTELIVIAKEDLKTFFIDAVLEDLKALERTKS